MPKETGRHLKKALTSATGLIALLLILILVNVILSYANIRFDTTEEQIYSLSDGTKKILSDMTSPVTIKFFCNRSNRSFPVDLKIYSRRVLDFLSEYEYASKGKVTVEFFDFGVDSDEEEWAQKYGVRPIPTATGENFYFGLVFLSLEQEETIELLDPAHEELMEYDITRIIQRIQSTKKPVIGIMSFLSVFGQPQIRSMPGQSASTEPWFFVTELGKTYEILPIDFSEGKIDPSVDLLVIVYPKHLPPETEYAIDQYILSGGNALIFVDPFCVSDESSQGMQGFQEPPTASLTRLFEAWGISMDMTRVVADFDHPTMLRIGNSPPQSNPLWISATDDSFDNSDVVTSLLENMILPISGAITQEEGSEHEFKPMIRSGKNASIVDAFQANFGPDSLDQDLTPADEQLNYAVQLRGKFQTAFPEGPPETEESDAAAAEEEAEKDSVEEEKKTHLATGADTATLIIVADADMLADRFYVRKNNYVGLVIARTFNDNLNFLANACEILTGSNDLIGLRSRGTFKRPFTVVQALERRAQERWRAEENELLKRMEETNLRLSELERQKDDSQRLIISPEQEAEISKFKEERRRNRQQLKEVRKKLRADINRLGATLAGINIFLMPFCVAIGGIIFALFRQRRIKKR